MANTPLVHQMVAREAAALLEETAPFIMGINKGRQSEFDVEINGYNKGDSVKIEIPNTGPVYDGAVFAGGGNANDNQRQYVNLTLDTQKHVGLQFTAKERKLDIADFRERFLRPKMVQLSSVIEADLLQKGVIGTPNIVGTPGTTPTQMKTFAQARAKLQNYLAPDADRRALISSETNTEIVDTSRQLFNPNPEISKQYREGSLGRAQGADFFEHQSLPVHTNGSKVTGVTVNGANQTGSTLNIGGLTAGDTILKGSIFTITGVNAIHPLTGASYGTTQQFVVTADFTASGTTGSIGIYPPIVPAMPNKTVSASPGAGASLAFVGAASTGYRQNLMFQKDAFTAAFAPLPVLASCEGYTARLPSGISVRVMTFGDGRNDQEMTRIDVLYGFQVIRGLHASRITQ